MVSPAEHDAAAFREHPALEGLVATIDAPIAVLTATGAILLVSRPFAQMLGVSREELEGQSFEGLVAPQERRRVSQLLERVRVEQETVRDFALHRPSGEKLYAHLSLRRLEPPDPDFVLLTAQDLTPRYRYTDLLRRQKEELEAQVRERTAELLAANEALRAANEALAVKQELLERILEQATDGIVARDPLGRVVFANAAAKRRARMPPEGTPLELAPAIWGKTFDPAGNLLHVETWPISRALRGETVTDAEWHRVLPDGTRYVVLNSAAPLRDRSGAIVGAVSITTDITERKRVEQDLRQALADKEALLREVHHRVKNNLQMLCDLLYLQMQALDSPQADVALRDAYGRVFVIARLHEQLYQSMQSGRVQLAEYLSRLVDGFKDLHPAVFISLEAPDTPVDLDVDRAIHTGLIVNELVTNALKHAFPGGRQGEVTVRLEAAGDRVELRVSDNGKGLPPGFSLEQSKTLGLRIVHILAQRLHATVQVEGPSGTMFAIGFPRGEDAPVEPPQG